MSRIRLQISIASFESIFDETEMIQAEYVIKL